MKKIILSLSIILVLFGCNKKELNTDTVLTCVASTEGTYYSIGNGHDADKQIETFIFTKEGKIIFQSSEAFWNDLPPYIYVYRVEGELTPLEIFEQYEETFYHNEFGDPDSYNLGKEFAYSIDGNSAVMRIYSSSNYFTDYEDGIILAEYYESLGIEGLIDSIHDGGDFICSVN